MGVNSLPKTVTRQRRSCDLNPGPSAPKSSVLTTQLPSHTHTHTHTHPFNGPFPGLPRWAGTIKVKPVWILLKQETVSGSGISWAICKSAPCSRQITMPVPHHSVFLQAGCPSCRQLTASKHCCRYQTYESWRSLVIILSLRYLHHQYFTYLACEYISK